MAADSGSLGGPDLARGIPSGDVADGAMLLGHAGGEAVLLARVDGVCYAVGATCTHYGGPLAEGRLDGADVRCPWHHACFDVRTGEARRAPALNPLARWSVDERDGRIVVGAKSERDPLAPVSKVPLNPAIRRVVILGAGAAGCAAAEMLRRTGFDGSIQVVDRESDAPYDRPNLSKDYLAGNAPEEWIPIRPDGFWREHGIEHVVATATKLDVANRRLELDKGVPLSYDALLLAPGAEPVRLPTPGIDQPHVHYLRSLADSRAIIASATRGARSATVIGASFIGLEVAASLRTRGLEVHVVAPDDVPLGRVMGRALGESIQRLHEAKGVVFHLGQTAERIERDAVVLKSGERLGADLVVVGVGVRPRLALAEAAGLAMDRGVRVNEYLETSAPGVYAAGDIARWPDPHTGEPIRVEHWVVAERHGQTAARNMVVAADARTPFDDVPFFWSAHYDVSINYVGHADSAENARVDGDPDARDVAVRFVERGKTTALATIFRDQESLRFEKELEASD